MAIETVTNGDIRDRLDSLRLEVKQDINTAITAVSMSQGRLEKKFDDLEAGRLTRLEGKYTDLALEFGIYKRKSTDDEKTLSSKFVALGAVGIVILTGLSSAFFLWMFKMIGKT